MSYNGAGEFEINTAGQPVVSGTVISATVFNALTTDIASGLSNCITKDGQQTVTANIPMSGYKFTNVGYGTAYTDSARIDNCNLLGVCEFRLSGLSLIPIPTTDVTAIETIFWVPYKGNRVALYDGSKWVMRTSAELSIDVPDATNMYDVFVYDNSGTVALELEAWASTTARSTSLALQDGVWMSGANSTRRYVGSFYCTTAGSGQTEDSAANRYIWNYYNRVPRSMRRTDSTTSWNYNTTSWRQANNSTSNQLNFVVGISEDVAFARVQGVFSMSSPGGSPRVGVALSDVSTISTSALNSILTASTSGYLYPMTSELYAVPSVGKQYFAWLEYGSGATTTFYGYASGAQVGIHGSILG